MKKILCILLAGILLCGCAQGQPAETTRPSEETKAPTIPTYVEPEESEKPTITTYPEADNPVKNLFISMGEDDKNILRMDVYYNEDGSARVEYVGKEKKVGIFDGNVLHGIAEAFLQSGLPALHGQDAYVEGKAIASMYVEMEDGTMFAVGYSGQIPQVYRDGYEKLDQFFAGLTADLPVYVPQPLVMGEVEGTLLWQMLDILNNSSIAYLDAYTISQVPKDEHFAFTVGLSSDEGIATAVSCAPMMMTDAYSLVIVKLNGVKAEDVCADFEKNLDWQKWVCVAPDKAMLAVKDDMVLCLMAMEQGFAYTAAGIAKTGWTEVKTLERP